VLLDTSVIIDPPPKHELAAYAEALAISVVTIAELEYGITADDDPMNQTYRRQRVHDTLERFDVLPFDIPTAEYYGALATLVRRHGRNPRARRLDLQIAASAARHGLALLTRNAADFAGLESAITVIDLPGTS
jgi:predicted nucleic acid-binding protein